MSYTSKILTELQTAGHKPIAVANIIGEETFLFLTDKEKNEAFDFINPNGKFGCYGWWYSCEDPTEKSFLDAIKLHCMGNHNQIPNVYWIKYD